MRRTVLVVDVLSLVSRLLCNQFPKHIRQYASLSHLEIILNRQLIHCIPKKKIDMPVVDKILRKLRSTDNLFASSKVGHVAILIILNIFSTEAVFEYSSDSDPEMRLC